MPFFSNAHRFIINGPSGQDNRGQAPPDPDEIVREAMLKAQRAMQTSSSDLTLLSGKTTSTQDLPTNKEFTSLSAGSAKFQGHIGLMDPEEQNFLNAELAKMHAQLNARDEKKARKAAEQAKNGGKKSNAGRQNGGYGGGSFQGPPPPTGAQTAWGPPLLVPPPGFEHLPGGMPPPPMMGFPGMNGFPPYPPMMGMGTQGVPPFAPPMPFGENMLPPGSIPPGGAGYPPYNPYMQYGTDPNSVPPSYDHGYFTGGPSPNHTVPLNPVDSLGRNNPVPEPQGGENREEEAEESIPSGSTRPLKN